MLLEIIIYITLFAALFSGAFAATFQSIDALHHLEEKKEVLNSKYFLMVRLNSWLEGSHDWQVLAFDKLNFEKKIEDIEHSYTLFMKNGNLNVECNDCAVGHISLLSAQNLEIKDFVPEILFTATSSVKILNIKLWVHDQQYFFSYYE